MSLRSRCQQLLARPHLRLIALVGLIVPRRLRADWRQEWETELRHREMLLAEWDRLGWRTRLDLLRRSSSAFRDAMWMQRKRLEGDMVQDLRYGLRILRTNPGFASVAVLTLALGIGANTAIFTLLDKLVIRTLPVERPHELVAFVGAGGEPAVFSYPGYVDLRDHNEVLAGLVAYLQRPITLSDGGRAERVIGLIVSGNYFDVLGVRPALGRFFLPEEDRTPGLHPVAVISHGLWRRRFGAAPDVLGRTITLNARPFTIVGVTPPEFTGTTPGTVNDVYVPTMMQAEAMPGTRSMLANSNAGWLRLIGRLEPGVGREQARAPLMAIAQAGWAGPGVKAPPKSSREFLLADGSRGHTDRINDVTLPLKLLMGVVGFVLLIACANVANLLLARASARSREIAVRLAVGADRLRIARQLLTEGSIIAVVAGGAALGVAYWVTALLQSFQQQTTDVPRAFDGGLDGRALAFTLGLSLVTGIACSLAPARQTSRQDVLDALKKGSPGLRGGWRLVSLRSLLVVAQVALSLVVLVGAGLFVKSLRALQSIDPGFEPARVVTASFDLSLNGYDEARGRRFMSDLLARVTALPGVEGASFANLVAFSDLFWISGASIDGYDPQPGERLAFDMNAIGPGYFRTMGTPLLTGREFTDRDTADGPRTIVVNDAAARRYWPGQNPIGRRTSRGEVVGVVADSREKGLTQRPKPAIYMPLLQSYAPQLTLHVRTAQNPEALAGAVRREAQALDAMLPIYNVRTLAEQRDGSLYAERMAAALLTLFGLLASLLAAVGIYGVLSCAVRERTREIGIRLAHGAPPRDLLKLVVGQGMLLTLIGLVFGVSASLALTRLLAGLLFGVSATDPLTFAVIPLALATVALLACWIPARRAMRMDPLVALRYE